MPPSDLDTSDHTGDAMSSESDHSDADAPRQAQWVDDDDEYLSEEKEETSAIAGPSRVNDVSSV